MATQSEHTDPAAMDADGSPLTAWFLRRFEKHLPAIRQSELLAVYFSSAYGDLYEYAAEFIRILHLINETTDPDSIASDARRMGWKWYRLEDSRDLVVAREENGDQVRRSNEDIADLDEMVERLRRERWPEEVRQQYEREAAWSAEHLPYITTGKPGESTRVTRDFAKVLPCYLFHVRYPNDFGDDYWTATSFLEGLGERTGDHALHWICYQLLPIGGRVRTMLRATEEALTDPNVLKDDIDERRKTRSIDLESVNTISSSTSKRVAAAAEIQRLLMRKPKDV
jgi:hypothetical protein